ncbi:hypothetical protein OVY01_19430 [Robbsia sp. Bb-Pol-6]|uniref:Uncharacterized protein n=1 Tax=Robbsia betulipollinis TaxID=2981849 RepID=A0ABT3ZRY6_9BURK|nr:hypothetical protein [Robbsia betulipollinis]MCY0389319.1 hypothetical protein [Robbsia betulipollinis]
MARALAAAGSSREPISPLAQALIANDLVAVRERLVEASTIPLERGTIVALWERSVRDDRLDMACAIALLVPDDWLHELSQRREDFDSGDDEQVALSLLHQAFRFKSPAFDELLKRFPYVGIRHDLGTNINNLELTFQRGQPLRCNSLAAYWIWCRLQHEASRARMRDLGAGVRTLPRFDAGVFAPDRVQREIPDGFRHGLSDLAGVSNDIEIIDACDWPAFTRREFDRLHEESRRGSAEPHAFYGIITPTHALACELKTKKAADGTPRFVRLLNDPNNRYLQTRASTRDARDVERWSLESGHEDPDAHENSFPDGERRILVFRCQRDAVEALVEGRPLPRTRDTARFARRLPEGAAKFTPQTMYLMLRARLMGSWRDLQPELREFARRVDRDRLQAVIAPCNPEGVPLFFHLLNHYPEATTAYVHAISALPVDDGVKMIILCAEDDEGRSPFATSTRRHHMRLALNGLGDTPFVRLLSRRLDAHSTTGRT